VVPTRRKPRRVDEWGSLALEWRRRDKI